MKKLTVLLSAVVCLSSAFGQSPNGLMPGGVPTRSKLPTVRMAHRPMVFSTGRVLTPADKARFIASAKLAFKTPAPRTSPGPAAAPAPNPNPGPTTQSITITQPWSGENFTMMAYAPSQWGPSQALIMQPTTPTTPSYIGFSVMATANNFYAVNFEVFSYGPAQFVIGTPSGATAPGAQPTMTVTVPQGLSGFIYGFDATTTGEVYFEISSSSSWNFESAELVTTPM